MFIHGFLGDSWKHWDVLSHWFRHTCMDQEEGRGKGRNKGRNKSWWLRSFRGR